MQNSNDSSTSFQIDPRVFLSFLIRYWYLILIGLTIGIVYAFYKVRYFPATYTTTSRMLVKDEYSSWGQEYFLPGMELVSGRNRLINEVGIIKSYPLMERVSKQLSWDVSYYKLGNIKKTELYPNSFFKVELISGDAFYSNNYIQFLQDGNFQIGSSKDSMDDSTIYEFGKPFKWKNSELVITLNVNEVESNAVYSFQFKELDGWTRYFQRSIQINVENSESSILILSESNRTPQKSIDFLNVLMQEYIQWGMDQNNKIAVNTIAFVDQQLKGIADSLVLTEHRLEQFQRKNFSERIFISKDGSNMVEVFKLEEELTQRSIQREYYSSLIKSLSSDGYSAFPSAAVFGFQDLNVDRMTARFQVLVEEQKEAGYKMQKASTLIKQKGLELLHQKEALRLVAEKSVNQVNFLIDSLKALIAHEEGKVMRIPEEQREYLNLKRENKLLSDLYTFLLNKRSEAGIAKASNVPKAQILDYATIYRSAYTGPQVSGIYSSAILVGLFLPILIILLAYLLNSKIIDKSDLEKITSIPILGTILLKKNLDGNMVVSKNLKSIVSESFRSIRTNINYMVKGKEQQLVMVTSSISGEGKTFMSVNLAAIYAASGKKTILVGADMRKPKIFRDFGLSNEVGLSTYLIRKGNLTDCVRKTKVKNLDLISSGPIPPNPAELLESNTMSEFLTELKSIYEIIIIDTPPVGLVTDALIISAHVDASVYIVRHGFSKKSYLENINMLYADQKIKNLGLVVNAVKEKRGPLGYGYSYGYGYGYGYGYYSEDKV